MAECLLKAEIACMCDKPLEVWVGKQILRKDLFENVLHILWQEVLGKKF